MSSNTTSPTIPSDVTYEKLFEKLNDSCVVFEITNNTPKIIRINKTFQETFVPDDVDTVIGQSLNDLIVPPSETDQATQLDEQTVAGEVNETIVKRQATTGIRDFLYRSIPIDGSYGFGVYIDITDKLRKTQYMDVLQRVLRHNLRNELTIVIGNAQHIIENTESDTIRKRAKAALNSSQRLNNLSEEADIIRNIINGHGDVDTYSIELQEVLSREADAVIDRFSEAEININCSDGLVAQAGGRIGHAFNALIDNGIRYSERDVPRVEITCEQVNNSTVQIVIQDNGPGLPISDKKVITGDATISPLEHGSGLGLWLTRWIIESYHGTISVQTRRIKGTEFTITLPVPDTV